MRRSGDALVRSFWLDLDHHLAGLADMAGEGRGGILAASRQADRASGAAR